MKGILKSILKILSKPETQAAPADDQSPREKEIKPLPYYLTENWKQYKQEVKDRLSKRIVKDLEKNDIQKAIDRYEGFFKRFPLEQDFHYHLGSLYMEMNDKVRAGKHLYFKENPSTKEQECIFRFEKQFGFDQAIILKKFLPKEHFSISACEPRIKALIKTKIEIIERETGQVPKFLIGVQNHLNKKSPLN
jgi:hypothetical protein